MSNIISTIVGFYPGTPGFSGDGGLATAAELQNPNAIAVDSAGNIYIADTYNYCIRVVNTQSTTKTILNVSIGAGDIKTVAGVPSSSGYNGDGFVATLAQLNIPEGISVDSSGNLYIADTYNQIIRRVDHSTGIITTVAGTPSSSGYSGDGASATLAQLNYPSAVVVDALDDIYISDTNNNVIRKVDHSTGNISTVVGNFSNSGSSGFGGDGGPANSSSVLLNFPNGVTLDSSGNLYIADNVNNVIRVVNLTGSPIIVYGVGPIAAGNIQTIAGDYSVYGTGGGYAGDGASASLAALAGPGYVTFDTSGNFYISDTANNVIRQVTSAGIISTIAGMQNINYHPHFISGGYSGDGGLATSALLNGPDGLVFYNNNLYISDTANNVIRAVTIAAAPPFEYYAALVQGQGTESIIVSSSPTPSIVPESIIPEGVNWAAIGVELLPSQNNSDNGVLFLASAVIGGLVVANPGQVAPVVFVATDCLQKGSRPDVSVLFDELPTQNFTTLAQGDNPVPDPTELPPSNTIFNDRWWVYETGEEMLCRWMFLKIDWTAENAANELLEYTVYGTITKE